MAEYKIVGLSLLAAALYIALKSRQEIKFWLWDKWGDTKDGFSHHKWKIAAVLILLGILLVLL